MLKATVGTLKVTEMKGVMEALCPGDDVTDLGVGAFWRDVKACADGKIKLSYIRGCLMVAFDKAREAHGKKIDDAVSVISEIDDA